MYPSLRREPESDWKLPGETFFPFYPTTHVSTLPTESTPTDPPSILQSIPLSLR